MPKNVRDHWIVISLCLAPAGAAAADLPFSNAVQTILDKHCVKCHGPLEQKSGLRLDRLESILQGGKSGPVVEKGKPAESRIVAVLAADAEPHMPPKKQLSDTDIAAIRDWITASGEPAKSDGPKATQVVPREPTAAIDHFIAIGWQSRRLAAAPLCDDRTFIRRASLDLIGRLPTPDEVSAYLFDASNNKRAVFVDRLLASAEAARNFREIWDALLMGRRGERREDRRKDGGWFDFLESAFAQSRGWDEVVRAMITARPEAPEDRGAIWFLFERRNEHQQIAEALAPIIYGTRIDCAQCHDHPLAAEIKQAHYWGLVSAFNRSKNVEKGKPAVRESAIGGFMNFTNLKKESQPAIISLLTGRTIAEDRPKTDATETDAAELYVDPKADVKVPKFSRRAALAEAATHGNPLLARSFVNHTWALLLGRGLVHPVDEINSKHPCSHPELLDWLAEDFAAHRYDVRRLIRSIVLSQAYQLASPAGDLRPPAEAFAAAAEKPLTAEAIARSMRIVSGRPPDDANLRLTIANRFPDVLPRTPRSSIQQAMLLANSAEVEALFRPEPGTSAARLAALPNLDERVRSAFRLTLIRDPDAEEMRRGIEYLTEHRAAPEAAVGQLLWALVSGPEFLTNH